MGSNLASIVISGLLTGCIFQPEPKVVQGEPYPAPNAKTQEERRDVGAPKVETATSATALDVTITQPTECRDQTPMVRDVTTERQANVTAQWINGGSALLLGGIGIYALAGPCTTTPQATSSDPTPSSQPCTASDKSTANATEGVLLGLGALFAGAFVYNAIRAHDSKETAPVHVEQQWKSCATRPLAGTALHLDLADGQQLVQTTNAQGQAHFDLTGVRWTDEALKAGQARVASGGQQLGTVNLTALPQYAEWQRRQQQEGEQQKTAAAQQAATAALQDVQQGLRAVGPPWTDPRMAAFARLVQKYRAIDATALTSNERTTYNAVGAKLDAMLPSFNTVVAANQARAATQAIPVGRQIVLSMIPTPSTARFFDDEILLQCPSGTFITKHVLDFQNEFGAMIRGQMCATFNITAGVKRCWNSVEGGIECSGDCGNHIPFGRMPTCDDLDNHGQVWRPY